MDGQAPASRACSRAAERPWQEAFDLFAEADARGLLGIADLPVFGNVAYGAGHLDVTIEMWERAYAELRAAGELVPAAGAAVRVAMHLLFDTALMAPVRGWLARAEQLLEDGGDTPAHAWLAVVRSYERMLIGDRSSARHGPGGPARSARRATRRRRPSDGSRKRGSSSSTATSTTGLALLDEAGVAATSGDLDALSTGVVYCELVCALQGLAQYDLAEEWTEAMERWSRTNAIGSLHGRCRVHRAEILRLRGQCHDAEAQALLACDELRPYLRRELGWPLTELGRIRLRLGDVAGAEEAFMAAHHAGWDPQPGLALVRLAQGDVETAAASHPRSARQPSLVPSKELPPSTELRRAPLLDAQVEIAIAAGDLDRARVGGRRARGRRRPLPEQGARRRCASRRARVRLAEGDATEAERLFAEAARAGAPSVRRTRRRSPASASPTRTRPTDASTRRRSELQAARSALDRIASEPSIVAVTPCGRRRARSEDRSDARNVFRREGDYWSLVFDGRTVRSPGPQGHALPRPPPRRPRA